MNTQDYISSGILEQYVSGLISAQEKQEVECMSHIYPEIAAELASLQKTMEVMAESFSKTPPAHLREQILGSIRALAVEGNNTTVPNNVASTPPANDEIVNMESENYYQGLNVKLNGMRIAASLLFLLATGLGYMFYNKNKTNQDLSNQVAMIKAQVDVQQEQLAIIQNPDYQKVLLAGIPAKSPNSNAIIYWNRKSSAVFFAKNNLPKPAANKQYQLWAIADGKPVDLGMIDSSNAEITFQKMKEISNATAFAITLEKVGGVASPTMEEMYVMGGI